MPPADNLETKLVEGHKRERTPITVKLQLLGQEILLDLLANSLLSLQFGVIPNQTINAIDIAPTNVPRMDDIVPPLADDKKLTHQLVESGLLIWPRGTNKADIAREHDVRSLHPLAEFEVVDQDADNLIITIRHEDEQLGQLGFDMLEEHDESPKLMERRRLFHDEAYRLP
jgi:hypothetical protein